MKKPIQRTGRLKLLHRLLPQYLKYVGFHQRKLYHETLVSSKKPQRILKNVQLPLQLFGCNQKRLSDHPNKQIYLENKKGPLDLNKRKLANASSHLQHETISQILKKTLFSLSAT